jgi:hypothetical protein
LYNLLNDFYNYINYRNELFLINNTLLYFLDFHFRIWDKKNISKGDIQESLSLINYIIEKIEVISLKNKRNSEFNMFIKSLKMHIEYVNYHYKDKFNAYIDYLFQSFSFTLFRNIQLSYSKHNWKNIFPEEWKISKDKIKNKKPIAAAFFDNFTIFINNHFYDMNKELELSIKNIIQGIFDNFEPNLLARLLFFILSQPISDNQILKENIETLIINLKSFELTQFNIDEKNSSQTVKNQIRDYKNISEKNTYEFMRYMFPNLFKPDILNSVINYLKELKNRYQKEPAAYYNIESYINILENMTEKK